MLIYSLYLVAIGLVTVWCSYITVGWIGACMTTGTDMKGTVIGLCHYTALVTMIKIINNILWAF